MGMWLSFQEEAQLLRLPLKSSVFAVIEEN